MASIEARDKQRLNPWSLSRGGSIAQLLKKLKVLSDL
jgi:hypothetical protein